MADDKPPHPLQPLWDKLEKFKNGNKGSELQLYEKNILKHYDPKDYDLSALHGYVTFEGDKNDVEEFEERIIYIVKSLKKSELNKITRYSFGKTALRMLIEDGRKEFKKRIHLIKWLCENGADPKAGLEEGEEIDTEEEEIKKILETCGKKKGGRRTRKVRKARKSRKTKSI